MSRDPAQPRAETAPERSLAARESPGLDARARRAGSLPKGELARYKPVKLARSGQSVDRPRRHRTQQTKPPRRKYPTRPRPTEKTGSQALFLQVRDVSSRKSALLG